MLMVSQSTQVYLDGAGGERLCDVNGCRHGEAGFSPLLSSWSRASGESGSLLRDSRWKALRTEARPSPIGFALIISDRRSSAAMALSVGESLAAVGGPLSCWCRLAHCALGAGGTGLFAKLLPCTSGDAGLLGSV